MSKVKVTVLTENENEKKIVFAHIFVKTSSIYIKSKLKRLGLATHFTQSYNTRQHRKRIFFSIFVFEKFFVNRLKTERHFSI